MIGKKIAVLLADGFEEGEALLTVDVLRRAGFTCDTVSVGEEVVCGSHGIRVLADRLLEETDPGFLNELFLYVLSFLYRIIQLLTDFLEILIDCTIVKCIFYF